MLTDLPDVMLEDIASLLNARELARLARAHPALRATAIAVGRLRLMSVAPTDWIDVRGLNLPRSEHEFCVHPLPDSIFCIFDLLCYLEMPAPGMPGWRRYDTGYNQMPHPQHYMHNQMPHLQYMHNWASLIACHDMLEVVLKHPRPKDDPTRDRPYNSPYYLGDVATWTKTRLEALTLYSISPARIHIEAGNHDFEGSLVIQAHLSSRSQPVPLVTVPTGWWTTFDERDRRRGRRNAMLPSEYPSEMAALTRQSSGAQRVLRALLAQTDSWFDPDTNPISVYTMLIVLVAYVTWRHTWLDTQVWSVRMASHVCIAVAVWLVLLCLVCISHDEPRYKHMSLPPWIPTFVPRRVRIPNIPWEMQVGVMIEGSVWITLMLYSPRIPGL